jgi:hypothetical protein
LQSGGKRMRSGVARSRREEMPQRVAADRSMQAECQSFSRQFEKRKILGNTWQLPCFKAFSPWPARRRKATNHGASRCSLSTPAKFEHSKIGGSQDHTLRQWRVASDATRRAEVDVLLCDRQSFPGPIHRTMRPGLRARCDRMFSHSREPSFSKKSFGSGAAAE